jgi:hypothetical protein
MATGQILGYDSKLFWRTSRLALWSFIITVALLDVVGLIDPPNIVQNPVQFLYLVAGWIAAYHILEMVKRR